MKNLEHQEQKTLIEWADMQPLARYTFKAGKVGDFLFSIPNGGKRGVITAKLLQLEGCRSGIPDLMLALPNKQYSGLFIEMKAQTKTARVSDNQKLWLSRLSDAGYKTQVCYGFEAAKQTIENYLMNKD